MSFLAPLLLLGLLLVPVLAGLYVWAQRRRTRYAVRFTNLDLLANVAPSRPGWRRHLPPILYLAAIAALVVGLARPTLVIPVPREEATVVLAIDVSGSMQATDVAPTRLDAARAAAASFVDQLPAGIRLGVVAFASQPVTLVSPTADRDVVLDALTRLEALDGTAMGDALMQVLDIAETIMTAAPDGAPGATAAPGASPAPDPAGEPGPDPSDGPADAPPLVAAILLSDGANSVGTAEPLAAARRGAVLGVPIYTIALGTDAGRVTVEDEFGFPVTLDVPPDRETLDRIAEITDATAFDAPTADDLRAVYDDLQSRIGFVDATEEVGSWFAGGALVLVVLAAGLSVLWFGRLP